MCPAIHINSRSWLRSSSTREPSDPPHRVVLAPLLTGAPWLDRRDGGNVPPDNLKRGRVSLERGRRDEGATQEVKARRTSSFELTNDNGVYWTAPPFPSASVRAGARECMPVGGGARSGADVSAAVESAGGCPDPLRPAAPRSTPVQVLLSCRGSYTPLSVSTPSGRVVAP